MTAGAALAAFLCPALLTALTGCGSSGAAGGQPDYAVAAGTISGLGRILVDGGGRTLYMYAPDHQGRSTCYAVCARQWPPLLLPPGVRRPVAGRGINAALLGTVTRTGGAVQVTYNRWPLYLYQADVQPGQATGQAADMGLWYVLSPSGALDRNQVRS
jgi:predicted lipoprotein with Yx(FWY)xxD motif